MSNCNCEDCAIRHSKYFSDAAKASEILSERKRDIAEKRAAAAEARVEELGLVLAVEVVIGFLILGWQP